MLQLACPRMRRMPKYIRAGWVRMRRRASGLGSRRVIRSRIAEHHADRIAAQVPGSGRNLTLHRLRSQHVYIPQGILHANRPSHS
jgi:hypothetical protein